MNLILSLDVFILPQGTVSSLCSRIWDFTLKAVRPPGLTLMGVVKCLWLTVGWGQKPAMALCDCSIFLPVPLQSKYMPIYIIQNLHPCHCHDSDLQSVLASEGNIYSSGKAATLPKDTRQGGQGKGLTGKHDSERHNRSRWWGVMLEHTVWKWNSFPSDCVDIVK